MKNSWWSRGAAKKETRVSRGWWNRRGCKRRATFAGLLAGRVGSSFKEAGEPLNDARDREWPRRDDKGDRIRGERASRLLRSPRRLELSWFSFLFSVVDGRKERARW